MQHVCGWGLGAHTVAAWNRSRWASPRSTASGASGSCGSPATTRPAVGGGCAAGDVRHPAGGGGPPEGGGRRAGRGGRVDTLAGFLESVWLPAKEGRVEPSTFDQYRWAVARHIVPLIGAVRLSDLRAEVVDAWLVQLSVAPAGGRKAASRGHVVPVGAQSAVDGLGGGGPAGLSPAQPGAADPAAPPGSLRPAAGLDHRAGPGVPVRHRRPSSLRRVPPVPGGRAAPG